MPRRVVLSIGLASIMLAWPGIRAQEAKPGETSELGSRIAALEARMAALQDQMRELTIRLKAAHALTPEQEYSLFSKAYLEARRDYFRQRNETPNAAERQKVDRDPVKDPFYFFAPRLLRLADSTASTPIALKSLCWIIDHPPITPSARNSAGAKALRQLQRDHIRDVSLATILARAGAHPGAEEFYRAVIDQNPHREVRGPAIFFLARFLQKDITSEKRQGEAVRLLERLERDFANVPAYPGNTEPNLQLGKLAEHYLWDYRNLPAGSKAPETVGDDVDGFRFRLSDYRGKVVLLVFWGDW